MSEAAAQVFVGHSKIDVAVAERAARALHASGISAWFDEWEVELGDSLSAKINDGISGSSVFLFLASANSLGSKWAQAEMGAALSRAVEGGISFVPARLDDTQLPPLLADRFYLDLRADEQFDVELSKLVAKLNGHTSKPPVVLSQQLDEPAVASLPVIGTFVVPEPVDPRLDEARIAFAASHFPDGRSVDVEQLAHLMRMPLQRAQDAALRLYAIHGDNLVPRSFSTTGVFPGSLARSIVQEWMHDESSYAPRAEISHVSVRYDENIKMNVMNAGFSTHGPVKSLQDRIVIDGKAFGPDGNVEPNIGRSYRGVPDNPTAEGQFQLVLIDDTGREFFQSIDPTTRKASAPTQLLPAWEWYQRG